MSSGAVAVAGRRASVRRFEMKVLRSTRSR
jgi:hypothetical protein